ncbi:MAG: inositol monophosphatase [Microthrixaceae bacterium]|nr:inositol monophosphatase [Microthrixaceae bacterium]
MSPTGLAGVALRAARIGAEVAANAQDGVRGDGSTRATKSSDTDLVTVADRAAEDAIRRELTGHRPDDRFLGEESASSHPADAPGDDDSLLWVVDPIDGTTNYVYGQPDWAVSVAATRGGVTVAAAVVAPRLGAEYVASLGGGATRNGAPLAVDVPPPMSRALVATGFGYDAGRRARQGTVAAALLPRVRDLRRRGAAALDFCFVADGSVDAYYEVGPQRWDFAAGSLVATEAGARVLTRPLDGNPPEGGHGWALLAAAPPLFDQLDEALSELRAFDG